MVVVVLCPMGIPEKVVAFEADNDAMPFIKKHLHLRQCDELDEALDTAIDELESIDDAQALIEDYALFNVMVHPVDEINPVVD